MQHIRVVRLTQRGLAVALLVGMLGALLGCATSSTTLSPTATSLPPTPLPTQSAEPQPSPVVGLLGPASTTCAAVAPPSVFTLQDFGGGFFGSTTFQGGAPVWELGLGSEPLHLNALAGGATPYPATTVMWVVGPDYAQPVTLSGHDIGSGVSLWFEVFAVDPNAQAVYTTHAVLDPARPNRGQAQNSSGVWNVWAVGIVVLAVGCYELDAAWSGGSWRTVFAAGA